MHHTSRRSLLKGLSGLAGIAAVDRLPGQSFLKNALAAPGERSVLVTVFLEGSYNGIFASADSYADGVFGCSAANKLVLGNGLVVDKSFEAFDTFARQHMASIGALHGNTSHPNARRLMMLDGGNYSRTDNKSYVLRLASALGGSGTIKAPVVGQRSVEQGFLGTGDLAKHTPQGGVTIQQIADIQSTLSLLGQSTANTGPNRDVMRGALEASEIMSDRTLARSPRALQDVDAAYGTAVASLGKTQATSVGFADIATAYGASPTSYQIKSFAQQMASAEIMVRTGSNVVTVVDFDASMNTFAGVWDDHGDHTATKQRNRWNAVIMPALSKFVNRMVGKDPNLNVVVAIMGDFGRQVPINKSTAHAGSLTASVIGKYVKMGTTGKVNAQGLLTNAPGVREMWSYLADVLKAPTNPFGSNPHKLVL